MSRKTFREKITNVLYSPDEDLALSPRSVLVDIVVTIIILGGALAVTWMLTAFPIPLIIQVVLVLLDITLFFQAFNRLLPIIAESILLIEGTIMLLLKALDDLRGFREQRVLDFTIDPGTSGEREVVVTVTLREQEIEVFQETVRLLHEAAVAARLQSVEEADEQDERS